MQTNRKETSIKQILEQSSEPLIINNHLQWALLDWNMEKWSQCLGDTELQFQLGSKAFSELPQWETRCESVKGTFSDFLKFDDVEKWLYFDYKYLNQWLVDKYDLRHEINWESFGYSDNTADDSTIWIGSVGAHTPCHIDSYGANLIAQVSGKKLWLLFPPDTDLKATRLPYEESTIYSRLNFYSPSKETIKLLAKTTTCKRVVLEPGQVLYVPHGWWHYVENLETAISINIWIASPQDDSKRVDEAITLLMTKLLTNCFQQEEQQLLINNAQSMQDLSITDIFKLLENSLKVNAAHKSAITSEMHAKTINSNIKSIDNLNANEFVEFLNNQRMRFAIVDENCDRNEHTDDDLLKSAQKYLSVLVCPDVIAVLKRKLHEAFENDTIKAAIP